MQKHMLKWGVMLMIAVAAWIGWGTPQALAQRARVPQTGQTTSYAEGDDGDFQAGVPFPTPRFKDNKNGTVTDNLTGLIWLKNSTCFTATWAEALTAANTLADGQCSLMDKSRAGDWRLPNIKELLSLIDYNHSFPALPADRPFSQAADNYWSSTTYARDPTQAWFIITGEDGNTNFTSKIERRPVWPVRGGD